MGSARQVIPNSFYLISRRCSQRQFLLRPDDATNNAYLYCLIESALRFQIELLVMCAMSNHHHLVIFDRLGNYPEFIEHLHKMIAARSQNALRGRWEHFWSSGQTSVVRLEDAQAVLDKVAYVVCNPVNDDLVERVHHWPGVNGYRYLVNGDTLRALRPRHFFRETGPMPAAVETTLRIPSELGDETVFREALEALVRETECRAAVERQSFGRRVLGRRAILAQEWQAAPTTYEPRRQLSPRVASRDAWARVAALIRNRWFVRAYQEARRVWLAGESVLFPPGTYWLRRFARVEIAAV